MLSMLVHRQALEGEPTETVGPAVLDSRLVEDGEVQRLKLQNPLGHSAARLTKREEPDQRLRICEHTEVLEAQVVVEALHRPSKTVALVLDGSPVGCRIRPADRPEGDDLLSPVGCDLAQDSPDPADLLSGIEGELKLQLEVGAVEEEICGEHLLEPFERRTLLSVRGKEMSLARRVLDRLRMDEVRQGLCLQGKVTDVVRVVADKAHPMMEVLAICGKLSISYHVELRAIRALTFA